MRCLTSIGRVLRDAAVRGGDGGVGDGGWDGSMSRLGKQVELMGPEEFGGVLLCRKLELDVTAYETSRPVTSWGPSATAESSSGHRLSQGYAGCIRIASGYHVEGIRREQQGPG